MKINDLKKQLQKESKDFVPDLKAQVFHSLNIETKNKLRNPSFKYRFKPIFAFSLLVLIFSISIFLINNSQNPVTPINVTYISIDINPSIELTVDQDDKVIDARPLNTDAVLLLEDSEGLKGRNSNDAITTIIDLASSLGFLNENNEVLITAFNEDQEKEDEINSNIKNHFINNKKVYVKEITEEIRRLAKSNNISARKMFLIQEVIEENPSITMEEALKMSIKKLNELLRNYSDESINEYRFKYRQGVKGLSESKNEEVAAYLNSINEIKESINEIKEMIKENEKPIVIKSYVDNLMKNHFPEYDYNEIVSNNFYLHLLNNLEQEINHKSELINELISIKYDTQINMFKRNTETNFNFETDFSFDEILANNEYNQFEKEAIKLIAQIQLLMNIANNNLFLLDEITIKIEKLVNDYNIIIASKEISNDFRENKIAKDVLDKYQGFRGNK